MKQQKLTTAGVILALSIFSSASCLAADKEKSSSSPKTKDNSGDVQEVLFHLFGPEDSVDRMKKKEEQAEQDRLWNEHYRNPPTDADRVAADRIAAKLNLPRKMFWPPVMASDQGQESTEKFIEAVSGNNKGAGGETSNQPNNARDQARDGAWEAAKAAASDVRGSVRSTIDGMKNCPDGH